MNVPVNFHKHKCVFCAFVWMHHNCNDVEHGRGGAHECPCCHRCNWSLGIYDGPEDPLVDNGILSQGGATYGMIHPDQDHITDI